MSTGYSRPAAGENPSQFYGVVQDATVFSDFVYQFLTRSGRWASPKFLIGESYGTTRSAQLSSILQQRHQIYLNGVVLISSVAFANWGADDRTKFFLPTYVTSAWFHHLLPSDLQKLSVEGVAEQARQFAHGEYAQALEKGDQLSPADNQKVVKDLARFTGFVHQVHRRGQLASQPAALVQGTGARQAAHDGPAGFAIRGHGCRCRRRALRVRFQRSVLRGCLCRDVSGLRTPRPRVEFRDVLHRQR